MTNIVLTGFMGCGKSTVGRILADRLDYHFVDTDHLIEERCAMTVSEIFAERGEAAFRSLEEEVAEELGKLSALVVATGGKLMLNPANLRTLGEGARIFCLTASPEEILRRLGGDEAIKRPLLRTEHPLQRIIALLEERRQGYRCFIQIDTDGKSPQTVAEEVLRLLGPLNGKA